MAKLFWILCFLFLSIQADCKKLIGAADSVSFFFQAYVEGMDGERITLVIPSYTGSQKLSAVVQNNSVVIEGKIADKEVAAKLMHDKDIVEPIGIYSAYPFILAEGKSVLRFSATQRKDYAGRYRLDHFEMLQGATALEYVKYKRVLTKIIDNVSFSIDPAYRDSIYTHVAPEKRRLFESTYMALEDSIQSAYIKVKLLEEFNRTFLYRNENGQLLANPVFMQEQFEKLQPQLRGHTDFAYFKDVLTEKAEQKAVEFRDYTLQTLTGDPVKLSSIVAANRYTVLYFWFGGCQPCRAFMKKEKRHYAAIRAKGIEFIAINTDEVYGVWKTISEKEQMQWYNLYAGTRSSIIHHYQVQAYPTKVIIDNQFKIVKQDFSSLRDLLKLE